MRKDRLKKDNALELSVSDRHRKRLEHSKPWLLFQYRRIHFVSLLTLVIAPKLVFSPRLHLY